MKLNANIKIAAIFDKGQILPRWFVWEGRKYDVQNINYVWNDREGEEKINYFAVSCGINCYELAYHTKQMVWRLIKVD